MITSSRKIQLITIIIANLLLAVITDAYADNFLIISDINHKYHQTIAEDIIKELEATEDSIDNISVDDTLNKDLSKYSSIITIGYKAASQTIRKVTKKPVLSLLIPKQAYSHLLKENIEINNRHFFSSIYIDQPLRRQILLIKFLSPSFKKIGILYGNNSYSRKGDITDEFNRNNLSVNNITVLDKSELLSETRHLSEEADILFAIPDSSIYNRRSIKGILLTTYRNNIPVLGYSNAYVKAGALAAIYSTPKNISLQAIEILKKHKKNKNTSTTRAHPKYFEVAVNNKVAHSLNLNIKNDTSLLKELILRESSDE